VRSGASWTWHSLDTQRHVSFTGINDLQNASYSANTGQLFTELGYTILDTNHHVEPIMQLAYVSLKSNRFHEQGSTVTALEEHNARDNVLYSTLGLRSSTLFLHNETHQYRLGGLLGWRHTSNQLVPESVFAFNSSAPFLISGTPLARNALLIDAGIEMALLRHNVKMKMAYSGQIASNLQDHGIQGIFSYRFL